MAQGNRNRNQEDMHFSSGFGDPEEKEVVWEIARAKEFLNLSDTDLPKTGITFKAGESIGIPATWFCNFKLLGNGVGSTENVTISLRLKEPAELNFVNASVAIKLTSGGAAFVETNFTSIMKFGAWAVNTDLTKASFLDKTKDTDRLEFILRLKVFPHDVFQPAIQSPGPSPPSPPNEKLFQEKVILDLEQLLESGDEADLFIFIPSELHCRKAHKVILMTRSPVFARMLAENTKMLEGNKGEVVLSDISSKGLDVLLKYVYTGKVSHNWVDVPEEVINAAEKYNLPQLKHFCGHNLMQAVNVKNARRLHKLANLLNMSFAAYAIREFVSRNVDQFLKVPDENENDSNEHEANEDENTTEE